MRKAIHTAWSMVMWCKHQNVLVYISCNHVIWGGGGGGIRGLMVRVSGPAGMRACVSVSVCQMNQCRKWILLNIVNLYFVMLLWVLKCFHSARFKNPQLDVCFSARVSVSHPRHIWCGGNLSPNITSNVVNFSQKGFSCLCKWWG